MHSRITQSRADSYAHHELELFLPPISLSFRKNPRDVRLPVPDIVRQPVIYVTSPKCASSRSSRVRHPLLPHQCCSQDFVKAWGAQKNFRSPIFSAAQFFPQPNFFRSPIFFPQPKYFSAVPIFFPPIYFLRLQ